jgi:uncharacterized protein (DUF302 family)
MENNLGFEVQFDQSFEQALELVVAALKAEGFGVLTRIDVKATMKEKLDADFRPYVILGACNPPLAYRALSSDGSVGLMLPCNVTVEATADGGALARFANPEVMLQVGELGENSTLQQVAGEARTRLERAAASLRRN